MAAKLKMVTLNYDMYKPIGNYMLVHRSKMCGRGPTYTTDEDDVDEKIPCISSGMPP